MARVECIERCAGGPKVGDLLKYGGDVYILAEVDCKKFMMMCLDGVRWNTGYDSIAKTVSNFPGERLPSGHVVKLTQE